MKRLLNWIFVVSIVSFGVGVDDLHNTELGFVGTYEFRSNTTIPESISLTAEYAKSRNLELTDEEAFLIGDTVWEMVNEYNFEPAEILALIEIESYFKPNAISCKEAKGLMQIMTCDHRGNIWLEELTRTGIINKETEVFEINNNIRAGCYILNKAYFETQDMDRAYWRYLGAVNH